MSEIKRISRKNLAKIYRALSNEKRIMIIQTMQMGIDKINDISLNTALPYKTVERHLKILVAAGVAKQIRSGKFFDFQLNNDERNPHLDPLNMLLKIIEDVH
jgi:DNA-binding transcriptional ArsR family regulator